mgnify:CR=1 FL=1
MGMGGESECVRIEWTIDTPPGGIGGSDDLLLFVHAALL